MDKPDEPLSESASGHDKELSGNKDVDQTPTAPPSFPEGGTKAWLVAAGHTMTMFTTWGYLYAFGVYQTYYETHQLRDHSPSDIAWIGSLQFFFMCLGMLFGGTLFDRFGGPIILLPATLIYVFSIMMTSICHKLWEFILAQGLLGGIGLGLLLGPSSAATPQYFNKKRGAAMGLALTGSSIGGVVFPIALERMLQNTNLGFGWSVRICGFIILGLMVPSSLVIRPRLPPRKREFFLPPAFLDIPYAWIVFACFCIFMAIFTPPIFLPTFAVEKGMSVPLANYLIAILNAASWPSRLLCGVMADKFGALNTITFVAVGTGITLLCWQVVDTNAGIIVFAAMFGLISGGVLTAGMVAFASMPSNPQNIGTYIGMAFGVGGIATLIAPPIDGALIANYHGFTQVSILTGVFCLAGAVFAFLSKLAKGIGIFAKG